MIITKAREKRITANVLKRLSLIPKKSFGKVLDIGCGDGTISQCIRAITHADLYGIEILPEYGKSASLKGIKVKKGDVNQGIPFNDNMFDLVFAGEIIEHVHNPDFLVREIKRVLKRDGILILTTPNLASWYNRIFLLIGIQPHGMETSTEDARTGFGFLKKIKNPKPAGHIRLFTLPALKDLLTLHGFTIEKEAGCQSDFFPYPIYMLEKIFAFLPRLSSKLLIRARIG